jgi:selT/selW/selH-like putative selenoprotein
MLTLSSNLARKQATAPNEWTQETAARSSQAPFGGSIVVEYCVSGNYEPVASALAEAIYEEFGETVSLQPSRDGVFEVCIDGRLVFSKRASWRFPDHDEIFYHVKSR